MNLPLFYDQGLEAAAQACEAYAKELIEDLNPDPKLFEEGYYPETALEVAILNKMAWRIRMMKDAKDLRSVLTPEQIKRHEEGQLKYDNPEFKI